MTLVSGTRDLRRIVQRSTFETEDSAHYTGKVHRTHRRSYRWYSGTQGSKTQIGNSDAHLSPNLCAVSKQLREEGCSILYKQEIILEDTAALYVFVTAIGSFNRQLLAQVTVKGWGSSGGGNAHNFAAFAASKCS